jgi:hypothetical protein
MFGEIDVITVKALGEENFEGFDSDSERKTSERD